MNTYKMIMSNAQQTSCQSITMEEVNDNTAEQAVQDLLPMLKNGTRLELLRVDLETLTMPRVAVYNV